MKTDGLTSSIPGHVTHTQTPSSIPYSHTTSTKTPSSPSTTSSSSSTATTTTTKKPCPEEINRMLALKRTEQIEAETKKWKYEKKSMKYFV